MSVRRLTLLDLMILVAGAAPALLLYREYERTRPALTYVVSDENGPSKLRTWASIRGLVPGLAVYSFALLALRLLAPRPRGRQTWRAPGMTTGLATAFAFGIVLARVALDWPMLDRVDYPKVGTLGLRSMLTIRMVGMKDLVGPSVAFIWAFLWFGGGWRPEPNWLDRTGRGLGLLWIMLGLISWIIGLTN